MEIIKDFEKTNWKPVLYMTFYGLLREIAKEYGYALAVHGSLIRDMDLIAVAWVDETRPYEEMIDKMCEVVGGLMIDERPQAENNPTIKPHGRLAYSIHVAHGYIDISIIPPK